MNSANGLSKGAYAGRAAGEHGGGGDRSERAFAQERSHLIRPGVESAVGRAKRLGRAVECANGVPTGVIVKESVAAVLLRCENVCFDALTLTMKNIHNPGPVDIGRARERRRANLVAARPTKPV